jgi:hypothetical protein
MENNKTGTRSAESRFVDPLPQERVCNQLRIRYRGDVTAELPWPVSFGTIVPSLQHSAQHVRA